jgi:hypothetical protein
VKLVGISTETAKLHCLRRRQRVHTYKLELGKPTLRRADADDNGRSALKRPSGFRHWELVSPKAGRARPFLRVAQIPGRELPANRDISQMLLHNEDIGLRCFCGDKNHWWIWMEEEDPTGEGKRDCKAQNV